MLIFLVAFFLCASGTSTKVIDTKAVQEKVRPPASLVQVAIAQAVSGSLGVCALTLVLFSRSARSSYLLPN